MDNPRRDPEEPPGPIQPEDLLTTAARLVESGSLSEALPHLEAVLPRLRESIRAAHVDPAGSDSYAHPETQDRLAVLRERTTRLIAQVEAARREVENELRTVRSQRAFARQEGASDPGWFESQA